MSVILAGCGSTSHDLQVTEESQEVEKQLYEEKRLEAILHDLQVTEESQEVEKQLYEEKRLGAILAALDSAAAAKVPEPSTVCS